MGSHPCEEKSSSLKIFVGNLPTEISSEELKALFEEFGVVLECQVFRNHYALVELDGESRYLDAITSTNGKDVNGSKLIVEKFQNTLKASGVPLLKLSIKNVAASVTASQIIDLFMKYGYVQNCQLQDGMGSLEIEATGDIRTAIREMNGFVLDEHEIQVEPLINSTSTSVILNDSNNTSASSSAQCEPSVSSDTQSRPQPEKSAIRSRGRGRYPSSNSFQPRSSRPTPFRQPGPRQFYEDDQFYDGHHPKSGNFEEPYYEEDWTSDSTEAGSDFVPYSNRPPRGPFRGGFQGSPWRGRGPPLRPFGHRPIPPLFHSGPPRQPPPHFFYRGRGPRPLPMRRPPLMRGGMFPGRGRGRGFHPDFNSGPDNFPNAEENFHDDEVVSDSNNSPAPNVRNGTFPSRRRPMPLMRPYRGRRPMFTKPRLPNRTPPVEYGERYHVPAPSHADSFVPPIKFKRNNTKRTGPKKKKEPIIMFGPICPPPHMLVPPPDPDPFAGMPILPRHLLTPYPVPKKPKNSTQQIDFAMDSDI